MANCSSTEPAEYAWKPVNRDMKRATWRLAARVTSWAAGFACAWVGAVGCEGERTDAPARDPAEKVSQFQAGGALLPTQQVITPAGRQVELPGMRPQAIALSPDGQLLTTSGMTHDLVLVDPASGKVLQRVPLPPDRGGEAGEQDGSSHNLKPAKEPQLSYTGLAFSPDGSRIYLSNVYGSIKVFAVNDGHVVRPVGSLSLPKTGLDYQPRDIPAGLAFSPDGRKLYVCLNVSNRLLECDAANPDRSGLRTFDVGNAPFDVVLVGHKAYVSNWGGRRVDGNEPAGPIGIGAQVRVDPVRFIANEGSVSVVDLEAGRTIKEIIVGLHASALAATPDGEYVAVANANSDTVSVIDTATDDVVETISTRWQKEDLFGASPNALCFDPSGQRLYVCNGTQNSVAVVSFAPGRSKLQGLIPTGWFPGAVAFDAKRNGIDVANIKGVGSGRHIPPGEPVNELDRVILWAFAEDFGRIYERIVLIERLRAHHVRVREAFELAEDMMTSLENAELELARSVEDRTHATSGEELAIERLATPAVIGEQLTAREAEVLAMMVTGASNASIAERLIIKEGTVKSHVKHILRKLDAVNRAEAIARYMGRPPNGSGVR